MRALAGALLGAGITALVLQASKAAHMGAERTLTAVTLAYVGAVLLAHTWITEKTRGDP